MSVVKVEVHPIEQYANDILSGKIVSGKWIKLACKRFLNNLEHGAERGVYFDWDEADRAIEFFSYLNLWEGEWAGEPFHLRLWQQFYVGNVFGWKREDGHRRFRTVYLEIGRKNAKSTLSAGVGLYMLDMDGEHGAQVYSAATKRDQAKIIFECAKNLVESSPNLQGRITTLKHNMSVIETRSKFEPLAADSKKADGLSISCALVDELHAHPNRNLYDVLETATGARTQPLIINVTTAGYDRNSICYEHHDYSKKILEGIIQDDTYFPLIYAIDEGDDWRDESCWIKANPNIGVSVKLDDLIRKRNKAEQLPGAQNAFRRLHCNEWTEQANRWLDMLLWDANIGQVDYNELLGRDCYAGLDLSSTQDLTALVLVFPEDEGVMKYKVLVFFWMPGDNVRKRVDKDRVPYDVWQKEEYLRITEGNVVDYDRVREDIKELGEKFNIKEIAFDRWNSTHLQTQLGGDGFTVVPFGQGFYSMSAPTKELEKLLLGNQIEHGGNPIMRWMASNVAVRQDPAGNLKPDKEKSTEKIDGIVALIMALGRAMVREIESGSIYATRGVLTL